MNNHSIADPLRQLEGAYAPATLRAYRADLNHFIEWCHKHHQKAFPAAPGTVIEFIVSEGGKAVSTMERRLYSIKKLHALMGYPNPCEPAEVQIAIRRFRRSKPNRPRQALGISQDRLLKMIDTQPDTAQGIRNRALLSVGFDFLTRRSELSALRVQDVEMLADGTLRGLIRRSKTDPFGFGRLAYGSRRSTEYLETWLDVRSASAEWLFCPVVHGKCVDRPISTSQIRLIIKGAASAAGAKEDEVAAISGHSLRVGAAQELMMRGLDISAIMRAGGWKTADVVGRYVQKAEHNVWE